MELKNPKSSGTDSTVKTPSLPPIIQPWEQELLKDRDLQPAAELARFAALAAGPFHVLNPPQFRSNVRAFVQACKDAEIPATVYFARKANKSACWLPVIAEEDQGVDVASGPEFLGAMAAGISGHKLVVTGAEKPTSLLELAIRHDALVVVDSPSELFRINSLAIRIHGHDENSAAKNRGFTATQRARIMLRILPESQQHSRFGMTPGDWLSALQKLHDDHSIGVECIGASFHLNGYNARERGEQAHRLLDFITDLRQVGCPAKLIDIGGGFSIQYCPTRAWEQFSESALHSTQAEQVFHAAHAPTSTYPYGGQGNDGPSMLSEIFSIYHPTPRRNAMGTVAERLRSEHVELALEPGRALLQGTGMTVFPVQGVKQRQGYAIVTASGLSMSVSEQWKNSEFLPDMSLWRPSTSNADNSPTTQQLSIPTLTCVGGSSCMEYDMLTWRKVRLPMCPQRGDLLVYHNTAGYQMDKNESEFHQLRLPMRFIYEGPTTLPRIDRPLHEELP
ncbi:alanine racemase [Corynebacterium propinquum]